MAEEMKLQVGDDIQVVMIPVEKIIPNEWTPNEMDDAMFNRLCDDVSNGFFQPVLVVPHPEKEGEFRIVDGEHRYDAMKLADQEFIPAVVVSGELAADEDRQKLQTVKMNRIRGNMNKNKFKSLVEDLVQRHPLEYLADEMAYDDPEFLAELITDTRAQLPSAEMKQEFDKVKDEIKTVDDLSLVLNSLFTKYGDTLSHNYMILDFGGKKHIWVRLPGAGAYGMFKNKADLCKEHGVTYSSVLRLLMEGVNETWLKDNIDSLEEVNDDVDASDFFGEAAPQAD